MGGAWVWVGVWDAEGGCHGSLDEFSWVIACFPITYFRCQIELSHEEKTGILS